MASIFAAHITMCMALSCFYCTSECAAFKDVMELTIIYLQLFTLMYGLSGIEVKLIYLSVQKDHYIEAMHNHDLLMHEHFNGVHTCNCSVWTPTF